MVETSEHNKHAPFFARTQLPTHHGTFDVRVYREGDKEHVALIVGDVTDGEAVPVRIHSECLTSEVLGSLKCDCKAQLDFALDYIQKFERGVVLYLRQEGRGIGLGNKIRAYALQEVGADTVDANRLLGFADDLRAYDIAAEMLAALKVRSVHLLTNNPEKLTGLGAAGVNILERVPVIVGVNSVNLAYLETKRQRMGHLIPADNLAQTQR